jgi:DNA polymerase elongation subunit (family B)
MIREKILIDCKDYSDEFLEIIAEESFSVENDIVTTKEYEFSFTDEFKHLIPNPPKTVPNSLIFGKDTTEAIVGLEIVDSNVHMYLSDGSVVTTPNRYWIMAPRSLDRKFERLEGNLHYKFIRYFTDRQEFQKYRQIYRKKDIYSIYDEKEAAMVLNGMTLFKGMKTSDVSVLSFDIEAAGIVQDQYSKVFMISNTFRDSSGNITRKVFRVDEFVNDDTIMIREWCKWVRKMNPDILVGHNIYGYDLPYLKWCAGKRDASSVGLKLGRDGSEASFFRKSSEYRVDGSQTWTFFKCDVFGRQIIDTMFLATKYDYKREFPSWGLKPIIEFKGLVKKDRQFYDASLIRHNWADPVEREKIVQYGKDDSDDSLALYDIMCPSFFYYSQSIPKTFQQICWSATGSQINAFLVRSYLQEGHSIPVKEERRDYGGGISMGNPGLYEHVNKVDVASLYPSIVLTYKIYNRKKDPNANFLKMVEYFTKQRLENKRLSKETKDPYYEALEQSQKIVINSAYGTLGTSGLNFNSFADADFVTAKGREILTKGMEWVENNEFTLVNVDTDSFSYSAGKRLTKEEFDEHIASINSLFDKGISWEDDGQYKAVLVVKAKNYALLSYNKKKPIKIKGSGLKATTKEIALKELNDDVISTLLAKKPDRIFDMYNRYCSEVVRDSIDITRWTSKKTITKAVLKPERTTEQKINDAIQGLDVQEGDKIRVYFDPEKKVCLEQNYQNDHNTPVLLKKVKKSMQVFENVIGFDLLPDYSLKRNQDLMEEL